MRRFLCAVVFSFVLGSAGAWVGADNLHSDDSDAYDYFGYSVGIDGTYAVIGAQGDDAEGSGAGAAYVFEDDGGWGQVVKMTADTYAQAGASFGRAVAIHGDHIIVGAYGETVDGETAAGAVYFFSRDGTWPAAPSKRYTYPLPDAYDRHGYSVDITAGYAVAGIPYCDSYYGTDHGCARFFRWTGAAWFSSTIVQEPYPDYIDDYNKFGYSVAISGTYAVIGAPHSDYSGTDSGIAHVYHYNGSSWEHDQALVASDADADDMFGQSVAIDGDWVVVGAYREGDYDTGAAYVFKRETSQWTQTQKLVVNGSSSYDYIGISVAIDQANNVIIGAYGDDEEGSECGAAYIYDWVYGGWQTGWYFALTDTFTDPACSSYDYLGLAVDIDDGGGSFIVGVPYDDDSATNAGAVFIEDL